MSQRETERKLTGSHTLCNTYFTPVEQQHVLPIITSMNHCLPLGCQEDERERERERAQRGWKRMTESRDDDRNVCRARAKGRGSVERERQSEGRECESEGVRRQRARDGEKWTYMKFLNVENHLSAPIFSV